MTKLMLREYQKEVVDRIGNDNAIVKMPTGSGKTLVAAEFIRRGLRKDSKKMDDDATVATVITTGSSSTCAKNSIGSNGRELAALFLVPTCDLVTQQKRAIEAWIGDDYKVSEYMGGMASPVKFHVLVRNSDPFRHCSLSLHVSIYKFNHFCTLYFAADFNTSGFPGTLRSSCNHYFRRFIFVDFLIYVPAGRRACNKKNHPMHRFAGRISFVVYLMRCTIYSKNIPIASLLIE